eukprot:PhF_6_TR4479/c0_g1_i6/m.6150
MHVSSLIVASLILLGFMVPHTMTRSVFDFDYDIIDFYTNYKSTNTQIKSLQTVNRSTFTVRLFENVSFQDFFLFPPTSTDWYDYRSAEGISIQVIEGAMSKCDRFDAFIYPYPARFKMVYDNQNTFVLRARSWQDPIKPPRGEIWSLADLRLVLQNITFTSCIDGPPKRRFDWSLIFAESHFVPQTFSYLTLTSSIQRRFINFTSHCHQSTPCTYRVGIWLNRSVYESHIKRLNVTSFSEGIWNGSHWTAPWDNTSVLDTTLFGGKAAIPTDDFIGTPHLYLNTNLSYTIVDDTYESTTWCILRVKATVNCGAVYGNITLNISDFISLSTVAKVSPQRQPSVTLQRTTTAVSIQSFATHNSMTTMQTVVSIYAWKCHEVTKGTNIPWILSPPLMFGTIDDESESFSGIVFNACVVVAVTVIQFVILLMTKYYDKLQQQDLQQSIILSKCRFPNYTAWFSQRLYTGSMFFLGRYLGGGDGGDSDIGMSFFVVFLCLVTIMPYVWTTVYCKWYVHYEYTPCIHGDGWWGALFLPRGVWPTYAVEAFGSPLDDFDVNKHHMGLMQLVMVSMLSFVPGWQPQGEVCYACSITLFVCCIGCSIAEYRSYTFRVRMLSYTNMASVVCQGICILLVMLDEIAAKEVMLVLVNIIIVAELCAYWFSAYWEYRFIRHEETENCTTTHENPSFSNEKELSFIEATTQNDNDVLLFRSNSIKQTLSGQTNPEL